ncbi:MAG: phenylalanine--tRNA ligase subunit beta, partial [Chloroflexota bacterium]|nr:phenylalanine--tRNA ligase subunit beta [Chloroflexota bacterium]
KVGPSPAWMQKRIQMAGMRPINNVVDITNYVMLEMGQPLHAFSLDAVQGGKIIVRRAVEGEHIVTLDHVDRTLDPSMLAICDIHRPVALAGVMGGAESEITEGSANVLLESASFNPLSIRRTARVLKLPSEASYRFERTVDPNLTVPAMKRAAELMRKYAGGTIARGYRDVYPRPRRPTRIHFYTSEVERLLGVKVPPSQVAEILGRLEFKVDLPSNADAVGQDTTMLIDVPSYRNDVTLPADIVEEVARVMGYDLIPETLLYGGLPLQEINRTLQTEEQLRDIMVSCGMDEVLTYTVTHSEELEKLAKIESGATGQTEGLRYRSWDSTRAPVTIVNPVSSKQDVLRPTLLTNLLNTLRANLRLLPEQPVRIFEVGKIHTTPNDAEVSRRRDSLRAERDAYPRMQAWGQVEGEERLPTERRRLAGVMAGPRQARNRFVAGVEAADLLDFFDAKGVVEEMLSQMHMESVEWLRADAPLFHPGRSALLRAGDYDLGIVGELHPAVAREWDLPTGRVCAWDIDIEAIIEAQEERILYRAVSPHQPVRQDMAFVVESSVPAATVAEAIRKAAGGAAAEVSLFDIYTGKPVPEGQRSLAFAVTFSVADKPLTEEDVARIRRRIEGYLDREIGAKLRT